MQWHWFLRALSCCYIGKTDVSGILSSNGTVKGILNDSLVPVMDVGLVLTRGNLSNERLPFPLREISGELQVFSDMNGDKSSWLNISHLQARTPHSVFKTRGRINHLYSDIHYNLVTEASVYLDEFKSFIPQDMNITLEGRIEGEVRTDFTMSQAANLKLEEMKLSGSASLTDFGFVNDSLSMSADLAGIDFSVPNPNTSERNTKFAFFKISSGNLKTAKREVFSASMANTHIYLEMSDVRDTTAIPDLFCTFSFDTLRAGTDTINISIDKPYGNFSVSPRPGAPDQPAIQLAYTSYELRADMGRNSAL
jgi:hypothetical protein